MHHEAMMDPYMHLFYVHILVVEVESKGSAMNSSNGSYQILLYITYRTYTSNMDYFYRLTQLKAQTTERTNLKGIW